MRKLLFAFVLVLFLPIRVSANADLFFDGGKKHQTDHFTFSVPFDWLFAPDDDRLSFTTNPYMEYYGMSLDMSEQDYSSFSSLGQSALYDFLEAGIMSTFGGIEYSSFDFDKGGIPVRYILFTNPAGDVSMNCVIALWCVDGYVLTCFTTSVADSPQELQMNTQSIMDEVYFTDNPPPPVSPDQFSDSDYILISAGEVYGSDLIEAWIRHSSGFIFIKSKESGSASSIKSSTISNSVKMLKKLQKMVNDEHVEFERVFFETHADLVDLYGNESTSCVISFNLDRDSVMKINFDNFLPTNLQKISSSWYEHPSMKK